MPKRVTLKEVASAADVSYQTVSKVLNRQVRVSKETEERIHEAARRLGYHPDLRARNLRMRRSGMLGYSWAPPPTDQANSILDLFLRSMMDAAERTGYHVLPFPHREAPGELEGYHELINSGRVDGFVLSSVESDDPRVAFLKAQDFPFVGFGRTNPGEDISFVDVDGTAGIEMATEHLLGLGHRKIALLAWPRPSRVGEERLAGYLQVLKRADIAPREDWIARGEGRVAFGWLATSRWLECGPDDRPTAIVALNDAMAVGAMRAVQERGLRVGQDIAITGFDDSPLVQFLSPPLTSVRQPVWRVGQEVVRILAGILSGEPVKERQVVLEPRLVVRASSDPRMTTSRSTTLPISGGDTTIG